MASADPPRDLPVAHLSVSSVREFERCPLKWYRRRILGEPEISASGPQIVGSAIHRAEADSYQSRIDTGRLYPVRDVKDRYSDAFNLAREEAEAIGAVDWDDERPGRVKDTGLAVLERYHSLVAPTVVPVNTERRYDVAFEGLNWTFRGYLDLEVATTWGSEVADLKSRAPTKGIIKAPEAAVDLQVSGNLFARRAEGDPAAGFQFHNLVRAPRAKLTPAHLLITPAHRTDAELDAFAARLMHVAWMIEQCAQADRWPPAMPDSWWCSERFCGYWRSCEFGGMHRSMFRLEPIPARPVTDSLVVAAVQATARRDGTTTAQRVARHVGISVAQATGKLGASPRVLRERPVAGKGRGKQRVTYDPGGPAVYRLRQAGGPAGDVAQHAAGPPRAEATDG
jgi:hypothetical protein